MADERFMDEEVAARRGGAGPRGRRAGRDRVVAAIDAVLAEDSNLLRRLGET